MNYSPIAIFAFNRVDNLKETLNALINSANFSSSPVIIFLDGPRNVNDKKDCEDVAKLCDRYANYYKNIEVRKRKDNYGLAKNIIDGVTEIISKYKKVIVLEDDIVIGYRFIDYMNECLNLYRDNESIWHISGWSPENISSSKKVYCTRMMFCWGWATWDNRWEYFNKNPDRLLNEWSYEDIRRFNYSTASNYWNQILNNKLNNINTWAVFWYATIFENKGLCINVNKSLVKNIGFHGESTHKHSKKYKSLEQTISNEMPDIKINLFEEDEEIKIFLKKYFERNLSYAYILIIKFLVATKTYNFLMLKILNNKYLKKIKKILIT